MRLTRADLFEVTEGAAAHLASVGPEELGEVADREGGSSPPRLAGRRAGGQVDRASLRAPALQWQALVLPV